MQFLILDFGTIEKLQIKMNASANAAINTLVPMEKIKVDLFRIEESIFNSRGRRGGGSWAKLKEDTIRKKKSAIILEDTGALKHSVTQEGAEFQILEVDRAGIVFGTDRPWAATQQFGAPSKNVPARPFIRILPLDVTRWTNWITEHILKVYAT